MNQLNRGDLRRRVEEVVNIDKRNSRIVFLAVSLVMFIIFMVITWGMALSTPIIREALSDSRPTLLTVLIMMTVGWGTAIFFQALAAFMDFGFMERQSRDRATARALREEIFQDATEKAKNQPQEDDELVKLANDGELLPRDRADYKADGKRSVR